MFNFGGNTNQENTVDLSANCMATAKILDEHNRVNYFFKREPEENVPNDSGWRFYSGNESDEYLKQPNCFRIVTLGEICKIEKDIIINLSKSSVGMAYKRDIHGNFERCFD